MGRGQERHGSRAQHVDAQEPQRLREPETRDGDDVGRHSHQGERRQQHGSGRDRGQRGRQQAAEPPAEVVAVSATGLPQPRPLSVGGEPAEDEEQRHDLHQPAHRGEERPVLEGVLEHRPVRADGDADHKRVQQDDDREAECTDDVDGAVAADGPGAGPRRRRGPGVRGPSMGECDGGGHRGLLPRSGGPTEEASRDDAVGRVTPRSQSRPVPGYGSGVLQGNEVGGGRSPSSDRLTESARPGPRRRRG